MYELSAFEHERLRHFERTGFIGASRWAVDRDGRRTYMISRGDGSRPTVLIHGGLSHAGDWQRNMSPSSKRLTSCGSGS